MSRLRVHTAKAPAVPVVEEEVAVVVVVDMARGREMLECHRWATWSTTTKGEIWV